jgi:hypothetical protein
MGLYRRDASPKQLFHRNNGIFRIISVFLKKDLQWGWGRVNYRFGIALSQGVAVYL